MGKKIKEPSNAAAAAQEAESRKLKRKKSFKSGSEESSSGGVVFDLTEKTPPEEDSINVTPPEDLKQPGNLPEKQTIKIITNGLYEGTSIYIGPEKLKNPNISIKISKEFGVRVVFLKEESLF